ncbi:uncharacterized protein LOC129298317 isoform X1 [Prosopis cineraria]|uniref:uncharacterized protein LOC129298317 isoform X1 n=1 Tax=Prosopis cineraria TaxID=364024 RepID=UPI0024107D72|nr:uncharacterized protein LOC129298317 isoform X1 [Prosopis cineraria]
MDLGSEVEKKIKFDPKMERPQEYALHCDWVSFKTFFHNDPKALIQTFDLAGNTAIQVATRSDDPDLIRQLLDMLPDDNDRRQALRTGNAHKNTLLHQVIFCDNLEMVDTVLNYETDKKLKKIDDDEEDLLELLNDLSETPVYRAAKYGRLRMLKHMARLVDDIKKHFHRRQPKLDITSILHIAIIGQHFDVALWLSKKEGIEKVAFENDGNRLTCLQLLSRMPSVFRSYNSQSGFIDNLIYTLLPDKGYDDDDEDDGSVRGKGDLETGKKNLKKHISSSPSVFSRIYYTLWKIAAKEWDTVKEIWERKKKHMLAALLADFLVSRDNSWMDTKHGEPRTEVVLPVIQPSNIAATKKAKLEKTHSLEGPIPCKEYTPLLLAASTGIVEIVRKIIDLHPDAISHVSQHDEQNVLHVAVKHRQKQIYKLLKKYGTLRRLGCQMANQGRTLLHQVARMDYYDGGNQPGVVFQLQDELRWFERVKRIVPCPHQLYCNDHNLTARELFDLEHLEMLKEAQEWIKGTAQSCSAVSVLVATVVFAAAYTVPGGTDDNGVPVLLDSPLFLFFTIMDVVGLASSLISVMMFLSILTSPFQMQEFYKSLPRKLTMGFTLLFISLTTTLLAFGSTILLTIRMENKRWSSSLIYSATFFPVTLFGLTQFPIIMAVKYRMKRLKKTIKKVIPNDVITTISTKPKKKRVYSKYV